MKQKMYTEGRREDEKRSSLQDKAAGDSASIAKRRPETLLASALKTYLDMRAEPYLMFKVANHSVYMCVLHSSSRLKSAQLEP